MITRALERALISGKGRLVTHMHAVGQVGKIVVPKHNFIIIHQVTLYPFVSLDNVDPDITDLDGSIMNTYEFSNKDQSIRNAFMVKNSPLYYQHSANRRYVVNSQPVQYDTYMVFDEDVYLQVGKFKGLQTPDVSYGPLEPSSQVPYSPSGYYNSPNVLLSLKYSDNIYKPAGSDAADPSVPIPGNIYSDQPFPNLGNLGSGELPPVFDFNINTPCANIQYVVLNEVVRKDFQ